jgi:hypothetical protein
MVQSRSGSASSIEATFLLPLAQSFNGVLHAVERVAMVCWTGGGGSAGDLNFKFPTVFK